MDQQVKIFFKPRRGKIIIFSLISIIFILEYHPAGGFQSIGLIFGLLFEIIPSNSLILINQFILFVFIILTVFGIMAGLSAAISYLFSLILLSFLGPNVEMIGLILGYLLIIIYGYVLSCLIYLIFGEIKKRLIHP